MQEIAIHFSHIEKNNNNKSWDLRGCGFWVSILDFPFPIQSQSQWMNESLWTKSYQQVTQLQAGSPGRRWAWLRCQLPAWLQPREATWWLQMPSSLPWFKVLGTPFLTSVWDFQSMGHGTQGAGSCPPAVGLLCLLMIWSLICQSVVFPLPFCFFANEFISAIHQLSQYIALPFSLSLSPHPGHLFQKLYASVFRNEYCNTLT